MYHRVYSAIEYFIGHGCCTQYEPMLNHGENEDYRTKERKAAAAQRCCSLFSSRPRTDIFLYLKFVRFLSLSATGYPTNLKWQNYFYRKSFRNLWEIGNSEWPVFRYFKADIPRGNLIGTRGYSYRMWGTLEPGYWNPTGHQFYHFPRFSKNLAQVGRIYWYHLTEKKIILT